VLLNARTVVSCHSKSLPKASGTIIGGIEQIKPWVLSRKRKINW